MTYLDTLLEHLRAGGRQTVTEMAMTMYHGTSPKFLRSILKKGLQAYPPKRQDWGETQATYGGAYLTPWLRTAGRYAGDATRKEGKKEEVFVIMKIETRTPHVVPDEDRFIRLTDTIALDVTADLAKRMGWPSAGSFDVLSREREGKVDFKQWVPKWLARLNKFAESTGRSIRLSDDLVKRILRYHLVEVADLLRMMFVYRAAKELRSERNEYMLDLAKELGIPRDRAKARSDFIQALDKFSMKIQQLVSPKHEVRSLIDIGYRGKNRIVGVVSNHVNWNPKADRRDLVGTVYFGARNKETRTAMKKMSEPYDSAVWKDRNGRVVYEWSQK